MPEPNSGEAGQGLPPLRELNFRVHGKHTRLIPLKTEVREGFRKDDDGAGVHEQIAAELCTACRNCMSKPYETQPGSRNLQPRSAVTRRGRNRGRRRGVASDRSERLISGSFSWRRR